MLITGILIIAAGPWISSIETETHLLIPFGIRPENFSSVDYFPMIPWFGVILIGYGIGCLLYDKRLRAMGFELGKNTHSSQLLVLTAFFGRHSLLIYLIHQPIIIALLWLIIGKPKL
jgi:uncharacterized membrane protein